MFKKIILRLLSYLSEDWLLLALNEKNKAKIEETTLARKIQIRKYIFEVMPTIIPGWERNAIATDSKWNYFPLKNGEMPKFDYFIPNLPLYICILGPESASWEEAKILGVSKEQWETQQENIEILLDCLPKLATNGISTLPQLVIIKWDDPIDNWSLHKRLRIAGGE